MSATKLPEPWDYAYEWDGPFGTRKLSSAQHNGRKPDRSVPIYTADQMRAYGIACWKQGLEDAAKVAEAATQEYDPHFGRPLNLAYQCADAIRALAKEITP